MPTSPTQKPAARTTREVVGLVNRTVREVERTVRWYRTQAGGSSAVDRNGAAQVASGREQVS